MNFPSPASECRRSLKIETAGSSETQVYIYRTSRGHIPEVTKCENLTFSKSYEPWRSIKGVEFCDQLFAVKEGIFCMDLIIISLVHLQFCNVSIEPDI